MHFCAGGVFYATTITELAVGLRQTDRSISGFFISGCTGASYRSWRTPI